MTQVILAQDDHYEKMFQALSDPNAAKQQLQVLADQHRAVKAATDEFSKTRDEALKAQQALESKVAEHLRKETELSSLSSQLEAKAKDLESKNVEMSRREVEVGAREVKHKAVELALSEREKVLNTREQVIKTTQEDASNKLAEAIKLKTTFEDKLKRISEI